MYARYIVAMVDVVSKVPSREVCSHVCLYSSANAYMLMYRRVDKLENASESRIGWGIPSR